MLFFRRCLVLFFEPQEVVEFDLEGLLAGQSGARRRLRWMACAPHLQDPVEIDDVAREFLGSISPSEWSSDESLACSRSLLDQLVAQGLVVVRGSELAVGAEDQKIRDAFWWPASAALHRSSRWSGQDAAAATEAAGLSTAVGLRENLGVPPPAVAARNRQRTRLPLARATQLGDFDELLRRRATCRNFDQQRTLSLPTLACMLERVFGAQGLWQADENMVFVKKSSPSGGGLHPTEAYLLVQNVEGVAPGLYHYHPLDNALESLVAPKEPLDVLATRMVAGQHWFANAPVLVLMATRFARCFWKYRQHPKAYRAVIMDVGHLSQTLYLAATDLGLGAFVTCAINEADIERVLGLDPLEEGAMAVCGFGWRGEVMNNAEFDPAGHVWRN